MRPSLRGSRSCSESGGRSRHSTTTGNQQVLVAPLDLTGQASVAAFVGAWDGPLHILVNNAGVMATPEMRTPEGWELQFATNYLGHFALATGLYESLAAAGGARGSRGKRPLPSP